MGRADKETGEAASVQGSLEVSKLEDGKGDFVTQTTFVPSMNGHTGDMGNK